MSPSEPKLLGSLPKENRNQEIFPKKISFKCRPKPNKMALQRFQKRPTTNKVKDLATKYNEMSQENINPQKVTFQKATNCTLNCNNVNILLNAKLKDQKIKSKDCSDTIRNKKMFVPKVVVDIDLNEVPKPQVPQKQVPKLPTNDKNCLSVKTAIKLFENNKVDKQNKVIKPKPIAKIKPILKVSEDIKKPVLPIESKIIEEINEKVKLAKENQETIVAVTEKEKEKEDEEVSVNNDGKNSVINEIKQSVINEIKESVNNKEEKSVNNKEEKNVNNKEEKSVNNEGKNEVSTVKIENESKQDDSNVSLDKQAIFNQISQSRIDFFRKTKSLDKPKEKVVEPTPDVPIDKQAIFKQISQSKIDFSKKLEKPKEKQEYDFFKKLKRKTEQKTNEKSERKFVKLLKNQEEEDELVPNQSFLWTKTETDSKIKHDAEKVNRSDMPLPLPPVDFIPTLLEEYSNELIYDDVNTGDIGSNHSGDTEYDDIHIKEETYDDCEGDGYQYVSREHDNKELKTEYHYVGQKEEQAKYQNEENEKKDLDSVSNIYESIYDRKQEQHYIVSNVSEVSSDGSCNKSTYEKDNSIYGITPENNLHLSDVSLSTTGSEESTISRARSEHKSDASDEWVDEDTEPDEDNVRKLQERPKRKLQSSPSWSMKVRRQWSRRTKPDDSPQLSDSDHLYESIQVANTTSHEEQLIDDFDSESSNDEQEQPPSGPITTLLPQPPQNSIKQSLKEAGKLLRRNLTLKTNDISKSITEFKRKKKKSIENERRISDVTLNDNISDSSYSSDKNNKKTWRMSRLKRSSVGSNTENDLENKSIFYLDISHKNGVTDNNKVYERSVSEPGNRKSSRQEKILRPSKPPPPPPDKTEYACLDEDSFKRPTLDKHDRRKRCGDIWETERQSNFFVSEPLYQFYTASVYRNEREVLISQYEQEENEEVDEFYKIVNDKRTTLARTDEYCYRNILDIRTLWCLVPEVINSQILLSLTEQQKKLQEAKFEIITSEVSYKNSLSILHNHFIKNLSGVISRRDHKTLFTNIPNLITCSENLLKEFEQLWQSNIMLPNICEIVYNACNEFICYQKFCKNQVHMEQTLTELSCKNVEFSNMVKELESDPICQNQTLRSFLMLPMQRITRLPLLIGAVLSRLEPDHEEFDKCKITLDLLNRIVKECDDELTRMQRCEDMLRLSQQLEFPPEFKSIPVITSSRYIVKQGDVQQIVFREDSKLTFTKKFLKINLKLILFPDLLLVTKKKSDNNLVVIDHCPRNLLQLHYEETDFNLPFKKVGGTENSSKFVLALTMLENHEQKTVEMLFSFKEESELRRWVEVLTSKSSENPEECIYSEWDCPQVVALDDYIATQSDELSLCIGDVVNVLKKTTDGLYHGERLRDGARGWFPAECIKEILSPHLRAKNKKQRHEVLKQMGKFIDSQMRVSK